MLRLDQNKGFKKTLTLENGPLYAKYEVFFKRFGTKTFFLNMVENTFKRTTVSYIFSILW
jgi:hypothetical protein